MILTEYDEKKHFRTLYCEGMERGREEGREELLRELVKKKWDKGKVPPCRKSELRTIMRRRG